MSSTDPVPVRRSDSASAVSGLPRSRSRSPRSPSSSDPDSDSVAPWPPPAPVRGNNWRSLAVTPLEMFKPMLTATVVVPYYEAADELALTLAGLECQTYPRELFEVIVVDDGSDPPLEPVESTGLSVRVIHQDDLGFGLARARNNGARAASGDIVAFLDCDMVPEAWWLASHARWHHAASDLLTLGFRHHVDVEGISATAVRERSGSLAELFDGRPFQRPEWIEHRMSLTDDLASGADDVFRTVTGGNFAISADFFRQVGGFDESFTQWGCEDIEFGWRAYALGSVLVPERAALCWHQGEGAVLSETEEVSLRQQRDKLSHLVPDRRLRDSPPGRSYTVPQFVVTLEPGHAREEDILQTAEKVLASNVHDLVVWIEERASERFDRLRRLLDSDPRVCVGAAGGAAEAWPAAAFHVRVPTGAEVKPRMLDRLRNQLGSAISGESDLASGHRVTIVRGWAVHRSKRSGRSVREVGAALELDVDSLKVTQEAKPQGWLASKLHEPAKRMLLVRARLRRHASTLLVTAGRVRSFSDFEYFSATVARALAWRLRNIRWALRRAFLKGPGRMKNRLRIWLGLQPRSQRYVQRLARYPLGAEIVAVGRRASAVFAASTRVAGSVGEHHVDMILADSQRAGEAASGDSPDDGRRPVVAVLSRLHPQMSVQAFNPEAVNPIGWSADCEADSAALCSMLSISSGSVSSLQIGGGLLADLRSKHHLEDSIRDHRRAVQRAGVLAALAATGVVVHITEHDRELADCLGSELHDLMASPSVVDADAHHREQLSIAMRRCALRDHSLRSRARRILGTVGIGVPVPEVSILAPTRRPDRLVSVIDIVSRQTYPRLELGAGPAW